MRMRIRVTGRRDRGRRDAPMTYKMKGKQKLYKYLGASGDPSGNTGSQIIFLEKGMTCHWVHEDTLPP